MTDDRETIERRLGKKGSLHITRQDTRNPITLDMRIIAEIEKTGQEVETYHVAARKDANGLIYTVKTLERSEARVRPKPVDGVQP